MKVARARRIYFRWERYQRRSMLLKTSPLARYGFHLYNHNGYLRAIDRYAGAGRHVGSRPAGIREVRTFLYWTPAHYRARD